MRKWISATNVKWAVGWLALAGLALSWWQPFRSTNDNGPAWIYGNPEARFTVALYADLECPHCQMYLPQLQRWIVTNDHVNLAWHPLPLPQHELVSGREAEGSQNVLNATPTLRLIDNHTQRTLTLQGPIEPDALLSAVDLLSAPDISEVPADVISDMPN